MGEMEVPVDAYYGASTQRAVLNFPISGQPFPRRFIRALGLVKKAAAQTNRELGILSRRRAQAIAAAAQEVIDGKLDDHFPIDVYQTGSGTSTNTNANEVIATRATEILGGEKGSRLVHPNDHVNLGQSSNDVIPTAIQLASAMTIKDELVPGLERLQRALEAKSKEFWPVIKTGRTHLQDATPIRLGQEFKGYAGQIEESVRRARAGHAGCAGRGPWWAAHDRGEPLEDRLRHPAHGHRTGGRSRRAAIAGNATGFQHHARQSEPGHRRVVDDGGGSRPRQ